MDSGLKKELGLFDVFCVATGAMISSGLFILPAIAYGEVGPALFLSYIIAGFFALPAMLSTAELVTAMPKAGGDYFYVTRSMGYAAGTVGGAASWLSLSLKSAFALIGMGAYVAVIAHIPLKTTAVGLCSLFALVNILGIRQAGILQRYLVIGLLGTLFLYILRGFPSVMVERFVPFAPFGSSSVFAGAGLVFISYGGLIKIASIAEEVKEPGRNIPLGMIFSLIAAGLLYAITVFITVGVLSPEGLKNSLTPMSDGAREFMGNPGGVIMAASALFAFISTANAGIMSASRYPIAMSRDRLLPQFLKKVNDRFKTPHYSIIATSLFMVTAIGFMELEALVKLGSSLLILLHIMANGSVIIMRESRIQNYRPKFKAPFYPWLQAAGIILGFFLLFEMGAAQIYTVLVFIALGVLWYMTYGRSEAKREFALIHVIERMTAKELTGNYLESELKEVLKERDEIVEDRFDSIIAGCEIMDIGTSMGHEEFFKNAAEPLSGRLGAGGDYILKRLLERERESSTVLRGGLAIPHIVVEGEHKFEILLARCKEGLRFPGSASNVHAVFVLAGTRDERNFHLRALAAIAEIAQQRNFDKHWLSARNIDELRDIILLAERKRFLAK